ncbi:hypothetical protein DDE82_007871 [Stemphylium lycopersici]|nr:hypothetical protein TW65_04854 [Stemphylium lycopersici]RAQ99802.1 hypothetical protein DDE82_007871 [Stemphylium lycopersici]
MSLTHYQEDRMMFTGSEGHPPIPAGVPVSDIVAIITVRDPQALHVNRHTTHSKEELRTPVEGGDWSLDGCHIFLPLIQDQAVYSIGRSNSRGANGSTRDVYLPGTSAGIHQFDLIPVWDNDCWRLQSASETVAEVNGVPLQKSTHRTQKLEIQLPHAIYLRRDRVNRIIVDGLQADIWLLKSVRELYPSQTFELPELQARLQNVSSRDEIWAQDRHILIDEQVSTQSHRAVERFTGNIETVKLFRDDVNGQRDRNAEISKFAKAEVDASVVRYIRSAEVNQIPSAITETHQGYMSYAALENEIKSKHPGTRFAIASRLLRRLFSALAFFHFHGIIHGQVSKESVLLRLVDFKVESVLLVDYSSATSFDSGAVAPLEDMVRDSRPAIEIVENCCELWQLRKAATKDARNEEFMAKKTEEARQEFRVVERVVADFFGPKGNSPSSAKGKKLLRLLDVKQNQWHIAQNEQIHNATRREVGACRAAKIEEMEQEWESVQPPFQPGEHQCMLLTLGHPYLDGLVSTLYHDRWDATPREVCEKIVEIAGSVEEPWLTFPVKRIVSFTQGELGFKKSCILDWLAGCCEAYSEWRHVIDEECKRLIKPRNGHIWHEQIRDLQSALLTFRALPAFMRETLARLAADDIKDRPVTHIMETHQIVYHRPSRMFNITQMHRLVSPQQLTLCINNANLHCENFVEVRGEPKLEGLYVPLSLLLAFGMQFHLSVSVPSHAQELPAYDPADFSHVFHHVVLAHTGLVPWASVTREGKQFNFNAPLSPMAYEQSSTFLPTYFGNMKVLPKKPQGREVYPRPEHWWSFQTAEEIDEAAEQWRQKVLRAKNKSKATSSQPPEAGEAASPTPADKDAKMSRLMRYLGRRKRAWAQPVTSTKRRVDQKSAEGVVPTADNSGNLPLNADSRPADAPPEQRSSVLMSFLDKTVQGLERQAQGYAEGPSVGFPLTLEASFYRRSANENLLHTSAPQEPVAAKRAFTVASEGSFDIEDDIRQTEQWLSILDRATDGPQVAGLFNLDFHHTFRARGGGSDTEADSDEENAEKEKSSNRGETGNGGPKSPAEDLGDIIPLPSPTHQPGKLKRKLTRSLTAGSGTHMSPGMGGRIPLSHSFGGRSNYFHTPLASAQFLSRSFNQAQVHDENRLPINHTTGNSPSNTPLPSIPQKTPQMESRPAPTVLSSPPQSASEPSGPILAVSDWLRNQGGAGYDEDLPSTDDGRSSSEGSRGSDGSE